MTLLAEPVPTHVVLTLILSDGFLRCLEGVMRRVVGHIQKEGLVGLRSFFHELNGKVGHGMGRVKRSSIELLGDRPFLAIVAKRIVALEKIDGSGEVSPVTVKSKISGLSTQVPLA